MARRKLTTTLEEDVLNWLTLEAAQQSVQEGRRVNINDVIESLVQAERDRRERATP